MNDYNAIADFLNKFSQLTPWVQAVVSVSFCAVLAVWGHFLSEIVLAIFLRIMKFRYGHLPSSRASEGERGDPALFN